MHVSLTDRLEAWVREKVESGLYNNASEVVREALRTQMRTEQTRQDRYDALRRELQLGIDPADRGEISDWDKDAFLKEREAEAQADA
jgi:antitoxin ParD1/3/4